MGREILNKGVREDVITKVTFEQMPKGNEGAGAGSVWEACSTRDAARRVMDGLW